MTTPVTQPDKKFYPVLKKYADGDISASTAADEIYEMKVPGFEDPSPGDVVAWSRLVGYGIPSPTEDEAKAEAAEMLRKRAKTDTK